MEKLITKSFRRLLDKGVHRGFITYEELGKSLGKRHYTQKNIEEAFLHIFDNKVSLVEKRSDYRLSRKKDSTAPDDEKRLNIEKLLRAENMKAGEGSGLFCEIRLFSTQARRRDFGHINAINCKSFSHRLQFT